MQRETRVTLFRTILQVLKYENEVPDITVTQNINEINKKIAGNPPYSLLANNTE